MLDLDGTIYQTLDLKEGAWHATKANGRSVGIEIANIGAVPRARPDALRRLVQEGRAARRSSPIPGRPREVGHPRQVGRRSGPSRPDPVVGTIQGEDLQQYDLTPQQYDALIKLTATLHRRFPKIKLDYPRDADGKLLPDEAPRRRLRPLPGRPRPLPRPDQQGTPARPSSGTG